MKSRSAACQDRRDTSWITLLVGICAVMAFLLGLSAAKAPLDDRGRLVSLAFVVGAIIIPGCLLMAVRTRRPGP